MKTIGLVIIGIVLGVAATLSVDTFALAEGKPVYLVVSGTYKADADMSAYSEAALPLAQQAGIQVLARSASIEPEAVLEGSWDHDGFIIVERFPSMQALKSFWHSDEYQAAIPLRSGGVDMNFIIAVEGL